MTSHNRGVTGKNSLFGSTPMRLFVLTTTALFLSSCVATSTNTVQEKKLRLFGQAFCQMRDRDARAHDRAQETPETKAIAAVFQDYISAGDRSDGLDLAALVTPDTHDLFAQLARNALNADREELRSLPFALRFWSLSLRQDFPVEALQRMTGHDLVEAAAELGWFAAKSRVSSRLRHYFINDRFALAYLDLSCGEVDDFGYNFEKVDGEWRVDLVRTLRKHGIYLNRLASYVGVSQDVLLIKMLAAQSKRPVTEDIWVAPLSRIAPDTPSRGA